MAAKKKEKSEVDKTLEDKCVRCGHEKYHHAEFIDRTNATIQEAAQRRACQHSHEDDGNRIYDCNCPVFIDPAAPKDNDPKELTSQQEVLRWEALLKHLPWDWRECNEPPWDQLERGIKELKEKNWHLLKQVPLDLEGKTQTIPAEALRQYERIDVAAREVYDLFDEEELPANARPAWDEFGRALFEPDAPRVHTPGEAVFEASGGREVLKASSPDYEEKVESPVPSSEEYREAHDAGFLEGYKEGVEHGYLKRKMREFVHAFNRPRR